MTLFERRMILPTSRLPNPISPFFFLSCLSFHTPQQYPSCTVSIFYILHSTLTSSMLSLPSELTSYLESTRVFSSFMSQFSWFCAEKDDTPGAFDKQYISGFFIFCLFNKSSHRDTQMPVRGRAICKNLECMLVKFSN